MKDTKTDENWSEELKTHYNFLFRNCRGYSSGLFILVVDALFKQSFLINSLIFFLL